ncbi:M20 family metallopeptidase [Rossellomorea vietnamensis]|uniref:M20 family metallopeptidase n=1 Tax=Rossellomorea vietnamensis TaxID=218284 RepID=A0A5D4MIP6_9BACI|nr:M20 family metallopeptidase [Rossellomorea vietnamensis]TYS01457.1 M20 family metallopeptidase [Rossellomorea vietnamensis]
MKEYIQYKQDEMLKLIEELVNIDSGSVNKAGVDLVGSRLKAEYEKIGFMIHEVPQEEYGNHLFIQHKEADEPEILVIAHMDTVFPFGTAIERPFRRIGNKAYGPGVIDMKSSLVTLLFAMKALIKEGSPHYKNVQIILNSDEEIGSPSSKELIIDAAGGKKYALIMEPARKDGSLVSSRRGKGNYTLNVIGRAAHSGIEPEKGRSAIEELAHKVIQMHELNDHENGISVNVGLIEGGSSVNTVSDHASAQMEIRIAETDQGYRVEEKMEKICSRTDVPGTEITLEGEINRPPMEKNKRNRQLLRKIMLVGEEMGIAITDTSTGGGSDASFTSAAGIATIDGMGPVGGNAHSDKEYLEISSLPERTLLLAKVIENLSE